MLTVSGAQLCRVTLASSSRNVLLTRINVLEKVHGPRGTSAAVLTNWMGGHSESAPRSSFSDGATEGTL